MNEKQILEGKRIFMVEDNIRNKAIGQLILEHAGATVGFERWGTTALDRLEKFAPVDVILLDLMFPRGITGYDIYDEIRSTKEFDGIPIIAVSASDPSTTIPKVREKGFAGFISKPIDLDTFADKIVEILEEQSIWYVG